MSRIYNGNHTRVDQVAGENLGHDVAGFVLRRNSPGVPSRTDRSEGPERRAAAATAAARGALTVPGTLARHRKGGTPPP